MSSKNYRELFKELRKKKVSPEADDEFIVILEGELEDLKQQKTAADNNVLSIKSTIEKTEREILNLEKELDSLRTSLSVDNIACDVSKKEEGKGGPRTATAAATSSRKKRKKNQKNQSDKEVAKEMDAVFNENNISASATNEEVEASMKNAAIADDNRDESGE